MKQQPRFIPPGIKDVGLENYLNENYTEKGGYTEFVKRHATLHEPKTVIAKAFGVSRQTVSAWVEIYGEENK